MEACGYKMMRLGQTTPREMIADEVRALMQMRDLRAQINYDVACVDG